jgi:hypothetical protein
LADRNTAAAKQKNKEKEFMGAFEDFLGVKFPERI